jgi:hypothetical protein
MRWGQDGRVGRSHLGREVLEDGGEVDGRAGADALRVLPGLEEPRDAAHGELQPGLGRPRHRLRALRLAPSSAGTHLRRVRCLLVRRICCCWL